TNDVTRLQALVDKKKVVITEAAIRDVLQLDDAKELIACPTKRFLLNWLVWVMRSHPRSSHSIRHSSQASESSSYTLFYSLWLLNAHHGMNLASKWHLQSFACPQEALDACAALTRRVEHLEYDKVAQALEITKLKRRVKKLEKGNRVKEDDPAEV
nr:hypothetical protein [Tanacetum cinerariifolium]